MSLSALGSLQSGMNVGMRPYIYRNNGITAASLNRITPIQNDVEQSHMDYSDLARVNPLQIGESSDYDSLVEAQYTFGMYAATRLGLL